MKIHFHKLESDRLKDVVSSAESILRDSMELFFVKTAGGVSRGYATIEEAQAYFGQHPEAVILKLNLDYEEVLKRAQPVLQLTQSLEKSEPQ